MTVSPETVAGPERTLRTTGSFEPEVGTLTLKGLLPYVLVWMVSTVLIVMLLNHILNDLDSRLPFLHDRLEFLINILS